MAAGVTVHLNRFEGPLGLLLFLIRKEEMDIMDINIGQITDQYLAYIRNMGSLDLENAGDFVAMAATLIHIKSKMLLPNYKDDEEETVEDPRKELVQKLLDYQVYKEASAELYARPLLNRDIWIKGAKEPLPEAPEDSIEVDDNPLFSLILSYRKVVKRVKKAVHHVTGRMQSVASRILEIKVYLKPGSWVSFFELMENTRKDMLEQKRRREQGESLEGEEFVSIAEGPEKTKLLITFLSLLELGKIGFVRLFQSDTYGDIHVEALRSVEKDVISQVEEYETLDNEQNANEIFDKALEQPLQIDFSDESDETDSGSENAQAELLATESVTSEVEGADNLMDAATDEDIAREEEELGLTSDLGLEV